jgi:Zn-dependent M28 family amino/carboxypeptidase
MSAAADRINESTRQPIEVKDDPHPFSDHWPFVRDGVPAFQLHSDSGERGRGWGHTHADTRDKVDDRNIREHAILTALLVDDLSTADAPRLDLDDLVATFRENDFEVGMEAAGLWPDDWK